MPSPAPQPTRARRWAPGSVLGAQVVAAGAGAIALAPPAAAATLTEVTNFGANPTNLRVSNPASAWNTGLTSNMTITNTGSSTINGWSLVFTLPSGQTITSGWNATYTPTSGQVTARNTSYDAVIQPGASTTIGFQATHTGDSGRPASFTLNGAMCTVA